MPMLKLKLIIDVIIRNGYGLENKYTVLNIMNHPLKSINLLFKYTLDIDKTYINSDKSKYF